ncbi:MAG: hypothetical protein JXB26_01455 [Candidatus Aminicenantes bacterium]|nr:hypothetical protein [Candidatus Aminicenantes bacterium]
MKKISLKLLFLILCLGFFLGSCDQLAELDLGIPGRIPGLDRILRAESPLSTGIADAVTEVPYLDNYNPTDAFPMTILPRTREGGFILENPGIYLFECQSYCLRAGTYAPGEARGGQGYLYAPLKGPQSDVIRRILKNSYLHPEIPQEDVQTLLWAVIARTKIEDMSARMKYTAAQLLTPEDIFRINGGALGLIPASLIDKALAGMPPAAQRILEAETRIRSMLTDLQASYDELERVAVLTGDPPWQEGDREVPFGRWSFHPDGYFIRYFPRGYKRMLVELSLPELIKVERDAHGRILLVADNHGNRLQAEYDDVIESPDLAAGSHFNGYFIRSLKYTWMDLENPEKKKQTEWKEPGWTFVGIPSEEGTSSGISSSEMEEYLTAAEKHKEELDSLLLGIEILKGKKLQPASHHWQEDILTLGHFTTTLEKSIDYSWNADTGTTHPADLLRKAWMVTFCDSLGLREEKPVFDLADDPVPGNGASQREGDSNRDTDKQKECGDQQSKCLDEARDKFDNMVKECLKNSGLNPEGCDTWKLRECVIEVYNGDRDVLDLRSCIFDACTGGFDETIDCIRSKMGWYYLAIKNCNKKYNECMGK